MIRWACRLALLVLNSATAGLNGCGGSPVAPSRSPAPFVLTAPKLLTPAAGAVIQQNDPSTGCPARPDSAYAYGFQIFFSWEPSQSSAGVASYQVYSKHPSAQLAAVDVRVPATQHLERRCNTFTANLNGWEWKVQAIDTNGQVSPWSEIRLYGFTR